MSNIAKEKPNDLIEDTQIESWENEGGAHANIASSVSRCRNIAPTSYLTSHISTAKYEIEAGNYEAACDELEAAAARYIEYKCNIQASFDSAIAKLTTMGCRATAPHPKALELIRLRRALNT